MSGEWRVTKSRFNLDHFQLRNRIMNHLALEIASEIHLIIFTFA